MDEEPEPVPATCLGVLGEVVMVERFEPLDAPPLVGVRPTSLGPLSVGIATIGVGIMPPGSPG